MDARIIQALLHLPPNAIDVAQGKRIEAFGQIGRFDDGQPVRLAHVGCGFGQKQIGRNANRAAQLAADGVVNRAFDLACQGFGIGAHALAAGQFAMHLVDGVHRLDRGARLHCEHQLVMVFDVQRRACLYYLDAFAQLARFMDRRAGLDAERFGLVAGGDAAGGFRQHRRHTHWLAAQPPLGLLLDRGEIGIEVNVERAKHGTGSCWVIIGTFVSQ